MCYTIRCPVCRGWRLAGCMRHRDVLLRHPEEEWCTCDGH